MASLSPNIVHAHGVRPALSLRGLSLRIALAASLLGVAGCKSEEEKFNAAAASLWGDLEDEHATFSEAINDDDIEAAAESLAAVEQMMLDFDAEHLGDRMCGWDGRLVCYRHLVKQDSHPVLIKFMEAYSGVERMGAVFEINYPGELDNRRAPQAATDTPPMPASEIDPNSLLPPSPD